MKITGFAQLRNELVKGNLIGWLKCMTSVCDKVYIFDQASDDGSQVYYKKFPNVVYYQSPTNNFSNEIGCKSFLLNEVLTNEPDTNWHFWLDGDTYLDKRLLEPGKIKDILSNYNNTDIDHLSLGHRNLWRSDTFYRTDDSYDGLHGGVFSLWRNNGKLFFPKQGGLHQRVIPLGLEKGERIDKKSKELYTLIHRGFATDYQIITKYDVYGARGQTGWALDRLLNEEGLQVEEIDKNILPEWYRIRKNNDPMVKTPIKQIYRELKGIE